MKKLTHIATGVYTKRGRLVAVSLSEDEAWDEARRDHWRRHEGTTMPLRKEMPGLGYVTRPVVISERAR